MSISCKVVLIAMYLQVVLPIKVKVVMNSDDESQLDDDDAQLPDGWEPKRNTETLLPFLKYKRKQSDKLTEYEESFTTQSTQLHHAEMVFPLIYKQKSINSMFKYGEVWYTWAVEKRTDGSTVVNYYYCNDEPKRCDDIGWDSVDTLPRCASQIEALLPNDRACINAFGVEPTHSNVCEGAEQLKISKLVSLCGSRIRSFWRFNRVGRRPANSARPADINSMFCEDEEECFITVEYRIHHDRITFSVHEPTRGQTFKTSLKREITNEDKKSPISEAKTNKSERSRKNKKEKKVLHGKTRSKKQDTKTIMNESNAKNSKRHSKNSIKHREDVSNDLSE